MGQYLAALKMTLDSIGSLPVSNQEEIAQLIAHCIHLTDESLKEVRTISYLLYPPMLEEMGLKSAVAWYLDGFTKRSSIRTTFEIDPNFSRLDRNLELALFRVLQESITNVHRHSGSSTATIRLCLVNGKVVMEIRDYGKGIPSCRSDQGREGWNGFFGVGLRGMNERIRQLGGTLEVCSTEGGTVVKASVPVGEPLSLTAKPA